MTKQISLSQEKMALVSDTDYKKVSELKWYYHNGYAWTRVGSRSADRKMGMHRFILNPPAGLEPDHINGNKLDNRRENLRLCTHSQNLANRKLQSNNITGFRGVCWVSRDQRYMASIKVKGKNIYLGYVKRAGEAAAAYDAKALEVFGEFANLNLSGGKV